eukprot:9538679-Lingulodinium_polyedra.AAC.1
MGGFWRNARASSPALLILYVARLHCALPIIQTRRRRGLTLHLATAKMARLLQPCDARVFATYKRRLQEGLVARQLES